MKRYATIELVSWLSPRTTSIVKPSQGRIIYEVGEAEASGPGPQ